MYISQYVTGVQPRSYFRGIYVVVHINMMLLRLFVLLISFPVLLCLVLNSIFHLVSSFKMAF